MKLRPVEQQVVVVFGASSGIGREAALQFASRGARVVVSARGEAGLNLFHPLPIRNSVEGDYDRQVMPSPYTWLQFNPRLRLAPTGGVIGATLLLLRRSRHHG